MVGHRSSRPKWLKADRAREEQTDQSAAVKPNKRTVLLPAIAVMSRAKEDEVFMVID